MPYIDKAFYDTDYGGTPVANDELLTRLIARASRDIDVITDYKIEFAGGIEEFSTFDQKQIKLATAAQVEFLAVNGETASSFTELSGGSFSVGSYSETKQGTSGSGGGRYSNSIHDYLMPTNLLFRGVGVRSDCYYG